MDNKSAQTSSCPDTLTSRRRPPNQPNEDRYRETLLESSQKFTQNLQSAGSSAMDTSRFQNDINKLINSMSSLTNMENGFDLNRITSTYMENIQTMASLMRNSFQMSLVSGTMENYIEMFNSVYGANTSFMSKVTSACMPNRRFGRV